MVLRRPLPSREQCRLIRIVIVVAALLLGAGLSACTRSGQESAEPPEKVTIACATQPEASLVRIAQSQGYFIQAGLEVAEHKHRYGKLALNEVLAGTADFATVAETPLMFAILKGADISVIATISVSNTGHAILARRDKGIQILADLKGKKIATTLGTTAHFYQDMLLAMNGLYPRDVQSVALDVDKITDVLTHGDVVAVSTFNPHIVLAQKALGDHLISFHDKDVYRYTFNIVATRAFIRNNPGKVKKLLRGLLSSEAFVSEYPSEAQKIISAFTGVDADLLSGIWGGYEFTVSLDQQLILLLEDESRWAISNGLSDGRQIPNYLNHIYFDGLKSLRPEAVRILR